MLVYYHLIFKEAPDQPPMCIMSWTLQGKRKLSGVHIVISKDKYPKKSALVAKKKWDPIANAPLESITAVIALLLLLLLSIVTFDCRLNSVCWKIHNFVLLWLMFLIFYLTHVGTIIHQNIDLIELYLDLLVLGLFVPYFSRYIHSPRDWIQSMNC